MNNPEHNVSETERVQQQSNEEWLDGLNGNLIASAPASQITTKQTPTVINHKQSRFHGSLRNAGIVSVKSVDDKLLIITDRHITHELDERIKKNIRRLANIAEPATEEPLYQYVSYRTLLKEYRPYLAIIFRDIRTGETAERFFNINIKKDNGEYFKTKPKGKFRVVGTTDRLMEGMFLKFWVTATKQIPDARPSHIYRYMKPWLSNAVVSCPNPDTKYEIKRLKKIIYEGHLYQAT